jgi:hypothetical protein
MDDTGKGDKTNERLVTKHSISGSGIDESFSKSNIRTSESECIWWMIWQVVPSSGRFAILQCTLQ